jgi:hypothetical protein
MTRLLALLALGLVLACDPGWGLTVQLSSDRGWNVECVNDVLSSSVPIGSIRRAGDFEGWGTQALVATGDGWPFSVFGPNQNAEIRLAFEKASFNRPVGLDLRRSQVMSLGISIGQRCAQTGRVDVRCIQIERSVAREGCPPAIR